MNNIPSNIICKKSIDRIKFSAHKNRVDIFFAKLEENCKRTKKNKILNFFVSMYRYKNSKIQIYHKITFNPEKKFERFYIQLLQPNDNVQHYMKKLLIETCSGFSVKQLNPIIMNVEVPHDFFAINMNELNDIHALFTNNLNLKYARTCSIGWYNNTSYRGKNGYVNKGGKGSRTYIKLFKNGKTACRFEPQFNARYLHDQGITVENLPLKPDDFDAINHFEILDNFSDKGIENLAKTILRKKGKRVVTRSKRHKFKLPIMMQWLRMKIFGAWHEDDYVSVPEQIDRVKELKKKYDLKVNSKIYFHPLFNLGEIVADLLEKPLNILEVNENNNLNENAIDVSEEHDSSQRIQLTRNNSRTVMKCQFAGKRDSAWQEGAGKPITLVGCDAEFKKTQGLGTARGDPARGFIG